VIQITQATFGHRFTEDARHAKRRLIGLKHPGNADSQPARRKARACQRDLNHIAGFEPVLSSQHQNVMHASMQGV
jgi:hypothetical protein